MSVIHAVQIFMLLWGFTTVCQAEPDVCSLRCNNVTGTVGNAVIFACSICGQSTKCCVTLHKFQYPENYNDSPNCKQELPNGICEKRSIFTCRYTPISAMKETFGFFVQVRHGKITAEFTVNISEPVKADALGRTGKEPNPPAGASGQNQHHGSEEPGHGNISGSAVSAGVGCFVIFMIIIILTSIIIYKKHRDERQEESFQAVRTNDGDNNTENVSFHCESDECS